jgi:hypothetical protein
MQHTHTFQIIAAALLHLPETYAAAASEQAILRVEPDRPT